MNIEPIQALIPSSAKDTRLNLSKVLSEEGSPGLNLSQIAGIALASALTSKNKTFIAAFEDASSNDLSDAHREAARLSATLMAMTNVYYRFTHLVKDDTFQQLPAGLRMQAVQNPGIEKLDFEMYSLAVSMINGCAMCMDAHTSAIMKHGISHQGVQSIARIAAVVSAANQAFSINESF